MTEQITQIANEIVAGRSALRQIAPIGERLGIATLGDAYAIQRATAAHWRNTGRRSSGYKIGLTSTAVQLQLGVDQPDFGTLWADYAYAEGATIPIARFMQPRIEAEVAFVLNRRLDDPDLPMTALIAAVDHVLPAIEIVDSVIEDWKISLFDTVADNASGGGYVLGNCPRDLRDLDLRLGGMVMSVNGQTRSSGLGAACLGHPLNAGLWLARKMASLGEPLAEGALILSGALGPMVDAHAGDAVTAEIQGFAPLTFSFGG